MNSHTFFSKKERIIMSKISRKIRLLGISNRESVNYLKLAFLEFFLLIIGILIALQVNNWNEQRKKENLKQTYVSALITDLEEDIRNIQEAMTLFESQIDDMNTMRERLISEYATADTLLAISVNEAEFGMPPFVTYNLNTFLTMQSTGNIDLLRFETIERMRSIHRLHDQELYYRNGNMDILKALLTDYLNLAPMPYSMLSGSRLMQNALTSIDKDELTILLNNYFTMKMFALSNSIHFYELIKEESHLLIELMQETEKRG